VLTLSDALPALHPILTSSLGVKYRTVETITPDVWPVRVDENDFELALLNLIVNARDAMPEGGLVTVTTENLRVQRGMAPGKFENESVAISIADNGRGIPPEILPKLFDPFFTTKEEGQGTRLGLSQVHGFAHQSGGTITIRSDLGKGTCVTLYLPRTPAERTASEPPAVARNAKVADLS
jgi:signal transduction histidine kinase